MGKKRRHSSPEPSELPYKKTAHDSSHVEALRSKDTDDSSVSSDTSSSSTSHRHRKTRKDKKKRKREENRQAEKHKRKHKKKKRKKHHSKKHNDSVGPEPSVTKDVASMSNEEEKALVPSTPAVVPSRQVRAPMTKAEWEKQQSIIRRVHDPTTGRDRLVKGDGEILEEIVTKERHKEINKKATLGDSLYYQSQSQLFSSAL